MKLIGIIKILLTLLLLFREANGWAIGPTHYEFNIENAMSDGVLNVHCMTNDDDLGLVRLPVHNNYTHGFDTQMFKATRYFCDLKAPGRVYKIFDTFRDMIEFVDHECGGRHCFWKAMDDGIYLFHIQKDKYFKKYDWSTYEPNNGDPLE
ncbi:hypothetical protein RND81_05G216300 [Saponaria officinalis]|uniref:S-protein homolog n=1 Tax=Saponaria officinalis TaxID=3572 RepID=A0AAW1L0M0_SAPOF